MPASVPSRARFAAAVLVLICTGAAVYGIATGMLASLSAPGAPDAAAAFEVRIGRLAAATTTGLGLILIGLALTPLALEHPRGGPRRRGTVAAALLGVAAAVLVTLTRWSAQAHPAFSVQWSRLASIEAVAWVLFAAALAAAWVLRAQSARGGATDRPAEG